MLCYVLLPCAPPTNVQFSSLEEYLVTFDPLILEEAREGLKADWAEACTAGRVWEVSACWGCAAAASGVAATQCSAMQRKTRWHAVRMPAGAHSGTRHGVGAQAHSADQFDFRSPLCASQPKPMHFHSVLTYLKVEVLGFQLAVHHNQSTHSGKPSLSPTNRWR